MKATTLCILMLLLVAQAKVADWTGTWYHSGGTDDWCCPSGLLTITQDNDGKATVEGKLDQYSSECKSFQLAGEQFKIEAHVEDNILIFLFTNGTIIRVTLERKDDGHSSITCGAGRSLYSHDLILKQNSTKFEDWAGSYSITPMNGTDDKCCFPESVDIANPETALYYSNIKWTDSNACKAANINGQQWPEVHTSVIVPSSPPEVIQVKTFGDNRRFEAHFFKYDNGTLVYKPSVTGISGLDCAATMDKKPESEPKSWTGIIIGVIVVLVLIAAAVIGYFVYVKRKNQVAHGNEYGQMVMA